MSNYLTNYYFFFFAIFKLRVKEYDTVGKAERTIGCNTSEKYNGGTSKRSGAMFVFS